jgi:integrase
VLRERVAGDAAYPYKRTTLGTADDVAVADGAKVLTYEAARQLAAQGGAKVQAASKAPLTVKRAMDAYLTALAARSTHAKEARQRAEKSILPVLGKHRVTQLTKKQIEDWRAGLVADDPADADARRRSQDNANRIFTILKAALNHAFADEANAIASDAAWRRVKAFKNVGTAREAHFAAPDVRTLVAKAATFDKAFANLLEAAYLTGARLSELTTLQVGDFDAARAVLSIRKGKTGQRPVTLSSEAVKFFQRLCVDRPARAVLLPRADGAPWGKSEHFRPFRRAAALAELPAGASFYALRHSHISRAIEAGMPLSLLAENCGTSLTMIQRNYAKVLAATRRDMIETTAPRLRRVK